MSGFVYRSSNKAELNRFLTRPYWQMMFSGCLKPETSWGNAERIFARWRTNAARETGLQIGTMGVFSAIKGHHLHVLMTGIDLRGRTLLDVDRVTAMQLELDWEERTHRTAELSVITSDGAAQYTANHLFYNPTVEFVCIHNTKLINRLKEKEKP